jgi:protein-S-isoprenylcysteine O-methyltransferase Ste14
LGPCRHPIYGGMLFAMLGTSLVERKMWSVAFITFGVYCVYCTIKEERLMAQQFPEQYPEYKKRTKMFIPFVL